MCVPYVSDSLEKCEYVMISVTTAAGRFSVCGKNFNVAILSDTIDTVYVRLRMVVVLIELYPFIPLSVTLIVF